MAKHELDETREYERILAQEEFILDVTEALCQRMNETGVTRTELARRMGRTKGYITQLLGGGRNLTLRTISDVAKALECTPAFALGDAEEEEKTSDSSQ
jgi:transcriptional regulator with XRE-family HTH domain